MRATVLALAFCVLPHATAQQLQQVEPDPLNVLWIIGEDLGPELACYGHPAVRTPRLDALAAEGVRFTRAFAPAPVCSPSRSGFMTGMDPRTIGAHNHRSHRDDGHALPDGVRVLTDWLRPHGVHTANVRKFPEPEEPWFSGSGKTDWNFHYEGQPFDSHDWATLAENQPFYAQVNFPETHRGGAWNRAHERVAQPVDSAQVVFPSYYPDHPLVRADWAQYLNAVQALDKRVGFVLDRLERDGLADSTVVIFFGDHGRAMIRGKQFPYDSGLHVPLLVRWPDGRAPAGCEPGTLDERLVSLLDVSASTLAAFDVELPAQMHGRRLWGAHAGPTRTAVFGGRDRGDETVDRVRTVRTERYRYLRNYLPERPLFQLNRYKEWSYPTLRLLRGMHARGELDEVQAALFAPTRPVEELYDVVADPYETKNLAGDPAHADARAELSRLLDAWIVAIDDQGRVPEPPEVLAHWEAHLEKNYGRRLRERAAAEERDR